MITLSVRYTVVNSEWEKGGDVMGPDWKGFVDSLISDIEKGKTSWGKHELVRFIKDKQIQFLEKALHIMDKEE